jgi:hypothetical protein
MSPLVRRFALCLVLVSLPAVGGPPREDRRAAARIRASSPRAETVPPAELQPAEVAPIAAAAADASGVDIAGFLGMLGALAVTIGYARGRRPAPARAPVRPPPGLFPPDRP